MPNGKKHPDVNNETEFRVWVVEEITRINTYMRLIGWFIGGIAAYALSDIGRWLIDVARASGG